MILPNEIQRFGENATDEFIQVSFISSHPIIITLQELKHHTYENFTFFKIKIYLVYTIFLQHMNVHTTIPSILVQ